jgi:hypothetical protein
MARRPLHQSRLVEYLAETKTMAQQLSYGGHTGASQAARNLARELSKELDRLAPKQQPPAQRAVSTTRAHGGRKILTRDAFRRAKAMPSGVIVNVDLPNNRAMAHRPSCDYMSLEHFEIKVIQNKGRNGAYYYFPSFLDARRALGAHACGACAANV